MANRRLACAWETLKQFAPAAPLMWIVRRLIETAPLDYAYGIAVMDFNYDSSDNDAFVQCTVEAMALIKQHDQMRFRRLQHHVRFIVNTEIPYSRGEYHWYGRMVHVDFQVSGVYPGTEDYW